MPNRNQSKKSGKKCSSCGELLSELPLNSNRNLITCDNWKCGKYRQPQGSVAAENLKDPRTGTWKFSKNMVERSTDGIIGLS